MQYTASAECNFYFEGLYYHVKSSIMILKRAKFRSLVFPNAAYMAIIGYEGAGTQTNSIPTRHQRDN